MATADAVRRVELDPQRAWALWTDLRRWPAFVEGFSRLVEQSSDWPQPGAKLVWSSIPGGRGRVSEKVTVSEPGERLCTEVAEDALAGTQLVAFSAADDGRTRVELRLDYKLANANPLKALADVLFIRRALAAALDRTLARFAAEAADEASL